MGEDYLTNNNQRIFANEKWLVNIGSVLMQYTVDLVLVLCGHIFVIFDFETGPGTAGCMQDQAAPKGSALPGPFGQASERSPILTMVSWYLVILRLWTTIWKFALPDQFGKQFMLWM